MRIKDILSPESMIMDLKAKNKDAIKEMLTLKLQPISLMTKMHLSSHLDRENESTTGIGGGIACLTHVTSQSTRLALFAKSKDGIDYNSLDGQPVTYSS